LRILKESEEIRKIKFHKGINLIVDETPFNGKDTGNNVGKTTVLKLIDFCLGGDGKEVYTDPENPKKEYELVKNFLIKNNIIIELLFSNNLELDKAQSIIIRRNFLIKKGKTIREINGENYSNEEDFEVALGRLFFPNLIYSKPTFRQLISHSIRVKDERINNILKTLDKYSSDIEYETLYLYMFNCPYAEGEEKQKCILNLSQNIAFKNRLENKGTINELEAILSIVNNQIEEKKFRGKSIEKMEVSRVLNELNDIKYKINRTSSDYSKLKIRLDLINDAEESISGQLSNIDLNAIKVLYMQANQVLGPMQTKFEQLVDYHNKMIKEKIKFITSDRQDIIDKLRELEKYIAILNDKKIELELKIREDDSYKELENKIVELNSLHERKGELESSIDRIKLIDQDISKDKETLKTLNETQFSNDFKEKLKN